MYGHAFFGGEPLAPDFDVVLNEHGFPRQMAAEDYPDAPAWVEPGLDPPQVEALPINYDNPANPAAVGAQLVPPNYDWSRPYWQRLANAIPNLVPPVIEHGAGLAAQYYGYGPEFQSLIRNPRYQVARNSLPYVAAFVAKHNPLSAAREAWSKKHTDYLASRYPRVLGRSNFTEANTASGNGSFCQSFSWQQNPQQEAILRPECFSAEGSAEGYLESKQSSCDTSFSSLEACPRQCFE